MKTALIAGATGLTGTELLKLLINDESYTRIHVISRRIPDLQSPKIIHHPALFNQLDELPIQQSIDEVYCTLGTTIKKAGTKAAFREVDFDAVVNLACWAKKVDVSRFVVISSIGANASSKNFYLRTKGQMETIVKQVNLNSLIIVRPSLLTGKRKETRTAERIAELVTFAITPFMVGKLRKYRPISAFKVALAMKSLAQSKFGDTYIIESDELEKIATQTLKNT
jgi:uncharacterized protein YbjT (DUF2867 family)